MKTKRIILSWVCIITLGFFWASSGEAVEVYELRGATAGALTHPYARGGEVFLKILETKSEGKIKGKWYHSGQVGGEMDIVSQINNNTLQFATISCALAGSLDPKPMTMYTPFLIKDWDTFFNKWVGSEGAKLILESLKGNGLIGLGWIPYGFNALAYKDPPIRTLEECKGRKLRAAQAYTIKGTLEALGMNAPPLPFPEVFQSIQQKVIEGLTTPPGIMVANRFHEVINNITVSDHLFGTYIFWMREKTLASMPEDLRKIVIDAAVEACFKQQKESKDFDDKAIDFLKSKGVKVWTISQQEKARWIAATKKVVIDHEKKVDEKSHDGRQFMRTVYKSLGRDYDKEILE
ncbi:MAG: TRAP transporter substrate-binding protein [Syntrophaceae bacterium]|nr:TRAP transporter substrate-binding protein [Syntrophaceae bacterium]